MTRVPDASELAALIGGYDAEGWHRTGSRVARRSVHRLGELVPGGPGRLRLEPFEFRRFVPSPGGLEAGPVRVPGVPSFDGGDSGPGGIEVVLGLDRGDGVAPVVDVPPMPQQHPVDDLRRMSSVEAIVSVTTGGAPGLALRNAPHADRPFGPPVLQVSSRHRRRVRDLAESGRRVRLVATGRRAVSRGWNVVVEADTHPGEPPLVVMTPLTGWWFCASERGGGVAAWVAAVRSLQGDPPRRPVVFVATQGHEISHPGLRSFLASRPWLIDPAVTWFHLGANIGARGWRPTLHGDDEATARLLVDELARAGCPDSIRRDRRLGDAGHLGETSTLSLTGGPSRHFHLPTDRMDETVDVDAVHRAAGAVVATVRALAERA